MERSAYAAWGEYLPDYTPAFQVQFINLANNNGWVACDGLNNWTAVHALAYCLDCEYCPWQVHHCAIKYCCPHRFTTNPEEYV